VVEEVISIQRYIRTDVRRKVIK